MALIMYLNNEKFAQIRQTNSTKSQQTFKVKSDYGTPVKTAAFPLFPSGQITFFQMPTPFPTDQIRNLPAIFPFRFFSLPD